MKSSDEFFIEKLRLLVKLSLCYLVCLGLLVAATEGVKAYLRASEPLCACPKVESTQAQTHEANR